MKKILLNLVMALGIGLFASCSQEEIISENENRVETVSVSAQLPGDAVQTRALPGAAADHKLRCILEVWNKTDNTLIERIEKLGSEATNGKLQFTFNVPSTTDYECLLWADFIASGATATKGKYTDKYYATTSLKAIDFKVTDAGLLNNESADAFCGRVAKNGSVNNLSVTLKRPFTKVTLTDNSDYLTDVSSLAPSFEAPGKFDVSTGKTAGYTAIAATGITPDATSKTLFSTFIFASADKAKLDKDIKIEFTKTGGETETKTIKAGQISLDPNVKNNVTADYAAEGTDVTVDVDIDDSYPDPNALKIGQFVNKDGSVTDTYNVKTACGIIFAVGVQGDDAAANYGTGFEGKTIAGYAMALSNVDGKPFSADPTMPDGSQEKALASFCGMKLTDGILSYIEQNTVEAPLFTNFATWKTNNAVTGNNLSTWYIPSYQQLVMFIGYIYGTPTSQTETDPAFPATITKNEAFGAAVTTASAGSFADTATKNLLSSSFTTAAKAAGVQIVSNVFTKTIVPGKLTNAMIMRPVLTVFKAE